MILNEELTQAAARAASRFGTDFADCPEPETAITDAIFDLLALSAQQGMNPAGQVYDAAAYHIAAALEGTADGNELEDLLHELSFPWSGDGDATRLQADAIRLAGLEGVITPHEWGT